jgi:DNA-binding SARP family transcriptional activator
MARLALGTALAGQHDPTARTWLEDARDLASDCGDVLVPLLADQWLAALDLTAGDLTAFGARADDVLARTADHHLVDIWLTPGWLGVADAAVRTAWLEAAGARAGGGVYAAHLLARIQGWRTDVRPTPVAGPGLRITTLNGFSVALGDTTFTAEAWSRRKAVDILLLLCASERHSQSRSEMLDRLWPDLAREPAAVRFRVALHALHNVLEPGRAHREATRFVRTSSDRVWLDPETVRVDADEFSSSADRLLAPGGFDLAAGQAALALYRQPFLDDYPAGEWAVPVRDELAVRFCELTLETARALLKVGDNAGAIAACRRLLTLDPFVEPAHELVAAAHLAAGDAAGAHRAFQDCARLLDEELGVTPAWSLDALRRSAARA